MPGQSKGPPRGGATEQSSGTEDPNSQRRVALYQHRQESSRVATILPEALERGQSCPLRAIWRGRRTGLSALRFGGGPTALRCIANLESTRRRTSRARSCRGTPRRRQFGDTADCKSVLRQTRRRRYVWSHVPLETLSGQAWETSANWGGSSGRSGRWKRPAPKRERVLAIGRGVSERSRRTSRGAHSKVTASTMSQASALQSPFPKGRTWDVMRVEGVAPPKFKNAKDRPRTAGCRNWPNGDGPFRSRSQADAREVRQPTAGGFADERGYPAGVSPSKRSLTVIGNAVALMVIAVNKARMREANLDLDQPGKKSFWDAAGGCRRH